MTNGAAGDDGRHPDEAEYYVLLEDLKQGLRISGVVPAEAVTVLAAQWHGTSAVELTYKTASGDLGQQVVFRKDEARLSIARTGGRAFDASATDFRIAAEAQRINLAGLSDPMLAVTTSDVRPLPHQISAVYGELLPRTPLRFLLADDPGAGKTIMAGLYVKELILRDDVQRCLIVVPGGLAEQWQDELFLKFGLRFDILGAQVADAGNVNVFERYPLLIARMDHLSRDDDLQTQLAQTDWDLVVVDEAHRMAAHYSAGNIDRTRRFKLGELLGGITRHLLLMTATPHSGKEDDFQLFLTLLDRDRYEGRGTATADTQGLMRRMIKEDLLTFEGKRLFPERIAETVPYDLTPLESDLYEQVTAYVREGMNRAERFGDRRRNTVGFALTILQRRLASSPEAIHQSLVRRGRRLALKRQEVLTRTHQEHSPDIDVEALDADEYTAQQIEEIEDKLLDAATTSQTAAELDAEIADITRLITLAEQVRQSGTDRKWTELRRLVEDHALTTDAHGRPRKLIIFTEHRDTLAYLTSHIQALLGTPAAVRAIHGGVHRTERRRITEEFTKNADVRILVATDAAGEGLNLQVAHLMVNYDLPWNPNRIEQRFGRIHRIGQTEVCRLWNLVARNTREGDVFATLLAKVDEQRKAYGGKVFDVLGEAFAETPLRDLLVQAIRYGQRPEVRARMHEIIDRTIGVGLREILRDRALASNRLSPTDLDALNDAMARARAQRMDPPYLEAAFQTAFTKLGGRMDRREPGRFEITDVPAKIRATKRGPVPPRYERVAFDLARMRPDGLATADLLAPGHPLHDAVMDETVERYTGTLNRGTVLTSPELGQPHLLVGVIEEVADATGATVARRFGYAYVDELGTITPAGPAPHLDCTPAPETPTTAAARSQPWLAHAEEKATSWFITNRLSGYLTEVGARRTAELARTRALVTKRLTTERDRLLADAHTAQAKELAGIKERESSESLRRKAASLDARLTQRLEMLDKQAAMSSRPPLIVAAALVLPAGKVA